MIKLRHALNLLDREALMLLADIRNLPGARSNEDRRESIARSYRGDVEAFFHDLRKIDLQIVLQGAWADNDDVPHRLRRATSYSREELIVIAIHLFTDDTMPPEYEPLGERREQEPPSPGLPATKPLRPAALAPALDAVLPSWIVPLNALPSSRDPLGLQVVASRHADELLPGLNVFTSRARYYSFLCWSIAEAQKEADTSLHVGRAQRLERLLVLGESLRHDPESNACNYVGRRRGSAFVRENNGDAHWALPTKVLKNQTSNGALRLYRTSLSDLGLTEELDLEGGLGVRLTERGSRLAARYEEKLDESVIHWALEANEQRKRRDTIATNAAAMCLSASMGGRERGYLVDALFARSIADNAPTALRRRETVRLLFEQGMLHHLDAREDITSDDADAVTDDGGASAQQAETRGNWSTIREIIQLPPSPTLQRMQIAGAFEVLGIALNQIFATMLDAVYERGRVSLSTFLNEVKEQVGSDFGTATLESLGRGRSVVAYTDDCLSGAVDDWRIMAGRGLHLLGCTLRSQRMVTWLTDPSTQDERGFIGSVLERRREITTLSPRSLLDGLVRDMVVHHHEVSAKKGKSEWVTLDDDHLVRVDRQQMRPSVHSLRFAQLQQLISDLRLRPEEVADGS